MKRKRIIAILLIVVMTCAIVGCEKQTSELETSKEDNKPEFKIVLVDKEIKEYIEKARNNEKEMDKLYREIVCEPIWKEIGMGEESFGLLIFYFKTIKRLDLLEKEMDILVNKDVVSIVESILEECNKFLPTVHTKVYIFPYDPTDRTFKYKLRGVGGMAAVSGEIFLFINPTHGDWEQRIKYVVAHEYHHRIWHDRNISKNRRTILEGLILEGRADSFANIVYPDINAPHKYNAMSINREKEIWEKIKQNLDSTDGDYYHKILFGDYEEFPLWAGYQIGYNIVQNFIKNNPKVSIEEWTDMDAKEILKRSGYEESLEKRLEEYNND